MSNTRRKLLNTAAVVVLVASLGTVANAQDNSGDRERTITRFDEIVVTARKREENIQETPLTISAFTSGMIEAAGILDMSDIAKNTPGFSLDDEFGRTSGIRPVIRGQSTILGASGVSTFVDGILFNGSILDYDLNDVERIEVVKGPQSALYGRNTYSGAINIITKSPSEEFSGDVKLDAGNFDRFEASVAMRGPINDVVSGSVNARYFSRGGPFTNTYDGTKVGQQESTSISGVLYYEPSDALSVRARARYSSLRDDQPRLFNTDPSENNIFQDVGGTYLGNSRYFAGEIVDHPISYDDVRLLDQKGFENVDSLQTSLSIKYDFNEKLSMEFINGLNSEKSDSAFDFGHTAESLNPFFVSLGALFGPGSNIYVISGPVADFASVGEGTSTDFSSELRFNYTEDKWSGLVGGYYFNGRGKSVGTRNAPQAFAQIVEDGYNTQLARAQGVCPTCFLHFNFGDDLTDLQLQADRGVRKSNRENLAVFGALNYDVTDRFAVSAEGRYKSEQVTNNTVNQYAIYNYLGTQVDFTSDPAVVREETFNSFNPRFTAKYSVSDTTNIYAIAARGDKPGGFNNTNTIALGFGSFEEETVWAFEGGIKNTLMDGRLILNLAGYHNTITDYQLTQAVTLAAINQTTTVTANVGKVRLMGLEAEMIYRVPSVDGLIINANYAYNDSEILKGTDIGEGRHLDTIDDGRVNCSIGYGDPDPDNDPTTPSDCEEGDNVLPGSIVGRRLPRSPKHSFSAGMSYSTPVSNVLDFNLNANMSYESKKFVQVHNLAFVGENLLVNGSIGFSTDKQSITIWGRNLTNEDAVVSVQRFIDEAGSFQRAFAGNPRVGRQYGITYRHSF